MSKESKIDKIAKEIAKLINQEFKDENDRLVVTNKVMSMVCSTSTATKVQSSGVAELLACKAIGLEWQKVSIHGADALDAYGKPVELKTTKRVKGSRQVNFNYRLPKRLAVDSDMCYEGKVVQDYTSDKKYAGGHYLVLFDQRKTSVIGWYHIEKKTMAAFAVMYARNHPTAISFNLGKSLCRKCDFMCWLSKYGKGVKYDPKSGKYISHACK